MVAEAADRAVQHLPDRAVVVGDHGGMVECESEPRRTVFRVLLPVANE